MAAEWCLATNWPESWKEYLWMILAAVLGYLSLLSLLNCLFLCLKDHPWRWFLWRWCETVQACGLQQHNSIAGRHCPCNGHSGHWIRRQGEEGKQKLAVCLVTDGLQNSSVRGFLELECQVLKKCLLTCTNMAPICMHSQADFVWKKWGCLNSVLGAITL